MLAPPDAAPVAAFQAAVVAAGAMGLGYLVVDALTTRLDIDRLARGALAFPGFVLYGFALMVLHAASGGRVLSSPWLVRTSALAVALALLLRRVRANRRRERSHEGRRGWVVIGLCLAGAALWGIPLTQALPLHFTPDTDLHMGWASQLMIGESSPSATVTGEVPNYYPWLYHSVVVVLASFTPGEHPFHALGPLQLVQVAGSVLALVALGREMTGRFVTGVAAAFFGALAGGLGIVLLWQPEILADVAGAQATEIPFLGDILARRTYNFAFNNFAPAFPRDASFTLLLSFLFLLSVGVRRRNLYVLGGAGGTLGLVGLCGAEALIVGAGVAALTCGAALPAGSRLRSTIAVFVPSVVVYGVWLVPLAIAYAQLGGFVNITHVGPVVVPPLNVAVTWGLVIPFALYGVARFLPRPRSDPATAIPAGVVVVAGVVMMSDAIPGLLGDAFLTLGRDHRYWPLLHLGIALYGALGASELVHRMAGRRFATVVTAGVVAAVSLASPVFGGLAYTDKYPRPELLEQTMRGHATLLSAMRSERRCVAAVSGERLARQVFAVTGYRLVLWVHDFDRRNWARIRFRDIYRRIPGDLQRFRDNEVLTTAGGTSRSWRETADEYDVNLVVIPTRRAGAPAVRGYRKQTFEVGDRSLTLVHVKECS